MTTLYPDTNSSLIRSTKERMFNKPRASTTNKLNSISYFVPIRERVCYTEIKSNRSRVPQTQPYPLFVLSRLTLMYRLFAFVNLLQSNLVTSFHLTIVPYSRTTFQPTPNVGDYLNRRPYLLTRRNALIPISIILVSSIILRRWFT